MAWDIPVVDKTSSNRTQAVQPHGRSHPKIAGTVHAQGSDHIIGNALLIDVRVHISLEPAGVGRKTIQPIPGPNPEG